MNEKWYFKPYVLVIAFLCVGPLALPLVWFNPGLSRKNKTVVSIVIIVLSWLIGVIVAKSLKTIYEYYSFLFQELQ